MCQQQILAGVSLTYNLNYMYIIAIININVRLSLKRWIDLLFYMYVTISILIPC